MPQPKEYYFNKLYPLQDAVLKAVAECGTDFYLTGGTALSRWYLHHRFSDDLDFFVNAADNFSDQVENYRAMTPQQKYDVMLSLLVSARRLKERYLRWAYPDWSKEWIQQEIREWLLYARQ